MANSFTEEDAALLDALGVEAPPVKTAKYTAREERIIAGFEDIQRFFEEHGRLPQHGEERDIFERLYAVRLDRIRASEECMTLLEQLDGDGLLKSQASQATEADDVSDEELLEALGVDAQPPDEITRMKHVRPNAERKSPDEVAQREPCKDFAQFRPVFEEVQRELDTGVRTTAKFQHNGTIDPGNMFILGGQKVLVAGTGKKFVQEFGREDRRLRVIFDNGTESRMLLRSLQRALYKDARNRRILPLDEESSPLFTEQLEDDDIQVGTIYVLRSLSDHPFIREHRDLIHKIGVTGGDIKARIGNAKKDPTFLLADVDVVATYKLANVNRKKLEALLHRFFDSARLDMELKDRFDRKVEPREWFLVPLGVIDEAVQKIKDGTISDVCYDAGTASLKRA